MCPCIVILASAQKSCKLDRLGIQLEHFDVTTSRIMLLFFLEGIVDYLDVITSIQREKQKQKTNTCSTPCSVAVWGIKCPLDRFSVQLQELALSIIEAYSQEYKITKRAIEWHSKKKDHGMQRAKEVVMLWEARYSRRVILQ